MPSYVIWADEACLKPSITRPKPGPNRPKFQQCAADLQFPTQSFPIGKSLHSFLPSSTQIDASAEEMRTAQIGATAALALHSLCAAGLAAGYWLAQSFYSSSLITDPTQTIHLLTVCEAPIVIGLFSWLRRDHDCCSFVKSVGRGLVGLPIGALINAFGAIVLGAPVGFKYWSATIYWSMLMSLFTFVPATCVFGASKIDWQHILSYSKPAHVVDYMISVPAHGAVFGAWLGAWPMPLDWERPWQEWPICVTYGAIAGHLIGMLVSPVLIFLHQRHIRTKAE